MKSVIVQDYEFPMQEFQASTSMHTPALLTLAYCECARDWKQGLGLASFPGTVQGLGMRLAWGLVCSYNHYHLPEIRLVNVLGMELSARFHENAVWK